MISRKLLAALLGLSLASTAITGASAANVPVSKDAPIAASPAATQKVAPKVGMTSTTLKRKTLARHSAAKLHRLHASRHAIKRLKIAKRDHGKRIVVSHAAKRGTPKHV